jgi:hypothetical protein
MMRQASFTRPAPRGDVSPVRTSGATALPEAERTFFESRLGHDFSHVRVHTDAEAAASADALGARAYVRGDDVVFAAGRYQPGTPQGRKLLAHELVHVAQQARGGGEASQPEARAHAAAEPAARGEPVAATAQGGAAPGLYCDADDDKKKLANAPSSSVMQLPPLTGGVATGLRPPTLLQPPGLFPSSMLQPPSLVPPLTSPGPLQPPFKLMANADILAPFSAYGVSPSRGGFDINGDWAMAYWTFRNYLPSDLAASAANIFLPAAYQARLGFDQPSIFDKSDRDFKAAFPDEKHIPPIPLVSSSTLTRVYEALSGKKNTNAFYF